MTTIAAFSFDEPLGTKWHDQSGFLNDLTNAGGTAGPGKWATPTTYGGLVCTAGGATGTMTSGASQSVSEWNDALATDTGSVGMWVKSASGASGTMVLFHANTTSGSNDYTSSNAFTIWASNASGYVAVSAKGTTTASTTNILDGNWHYVSVQAGGDLVSGGLAIKVDGTVVASRAALATTTGIPLYYSVGMALDATQKFNGTIDDVVGLNDPMDSSSGGTSETMFSGSPVTSALQLQWTMDETSSPAYDTSGNTRDLTVSTVTSTTGEHGNALTSGATQLAAATFWAQATPNLATSPRFTIMFWMNFKDTQVWSSATGLMEILGATSGIRFELFAETTGSQVKLMPRLYAADGATQNYAPTTGSIVFAEPNTWHHVAFTLAPTLIKPYIDGVSGTSGTLSPSMSYADWFKLNFASTRFASIPNVAFDDVRIVSNYLYTDAITRHMATANAAPPINPVTGTGSLALGGVSVAGTSVNSSSAVLSLSRVMASGTGTPVNQGLGALSLAPVTLSGSGTVTSNVTGSGALSLSRATAAGTGTLNNRGTGALQLSSTIASGHDSAKGSGTLYVPSVALIGVDTPPVAGIGALSLMPTQVSGADTPTWARRPIAISVWGTDVPPIPSDYVPAPEPSTNPWTRM